MEFLKNTITEAMLDRRSIRAYTDEKLTDDELYTILQCGLWAPSGRNEQTAKFVATQNKELLHAIAADMGDKVVLGYDAPCFIFVFDLLEGRWTPDNADFALENMHLAAYSLGLGSIMIGMCREFMRSEKGREWQKKMGIPDNYHFICGLAVGHTAAPTPPRPRNEENIIVLP